MKIKYNLLTWLQIMMIYPLSAFLLIFVLNTLAVIFGENQTYDLTALLIVTLQILVFVLLFLLLRSRYTSYMIFGEYDLKIYVKASLDKSIKYENIQSMKYTPFKLSSLFTFIMDETNMISIDYIDWDGSTKRFTAKIFKCEYKKIKIEIKQGRITMKTIEVLRSRLSEKNTIYAQSEEGFFREVGFVFNDPIGIDAINQFELTHRIVLPESYKRFLQISNGATLFEDIEYGQRGCKLLNIDEIMETTAHIKSLGYELPNSWIVFAKWLGDSDILILDLEKAKIKTENYIIYGESYEAEENWYYLNGDFETWIDRLIVAQGSKYWTW